jgi:hypothetical protein
VGVPYGTLSHLQVEQNHYRGVLQENFSPENQQRKALRHLNTLGIVISFTCFFKVIKLKLMNFSRKDDNRVTITDQSSESVNIEMIEMRTNIHALLERVTQLEKTEQINEKTIKVLQAENNKLRLHVS